MQWIQLKNVFSEVNHKLKHKKIISKFHLLNYRTRESFYHDVMHLACTRCTCSMYFFASQCRRINTHLVSHCIALHFICESNSNLLCAVVSIFFVVVCSFWCIKRIVIFVTSSMEFHRKTFNSVKHWKFSSIW